MKRRGGDKSRTVQGRRTEQEIGEYEGQSLLLIIKLYYFSIHNFKGKIALIVFSEKLKSLLIFIL